MSDFVQLFYACFSLVNLPYTLLLVFVLLYWGMVILGALDIDALDFDLDHDLDIDLDVDADIDVDADVDADMDVSVGGSSMMALLHFMNVGQLPIMVIVSFWVLAMWFGSIAANYYLGNLGKGASLLVALAILVPNVVLGVLAAKLLTTPLCALFKSASKEVIQFQQLCGSVGVVASGEVNDHYGQVEIKQKNGAPLLLNVVTRAGRTLQKGDYALLVQYDKASGIYTVDKSDSDI